MEADKQLPVLSVILAILLVFTNGCMNKYEKAAPGVYDVTEFRLLDTLSAAHTLDRPKMILNNNKTFLFTNSNKQIKGKWEAGDDGDRTWIRFSFDSIISDAVIVGNSLEIIELWNPQDFGYPLYKSLSFTRR